MSTVLNMLSNKGEPLGMRRRGEAGINIQGSIHLLERCIGLFEESVYYAFAKFSLVFIIVHFQDLLKGQLVNRIAEIREACRARVDLSRNVSACGSITIEIWGGLEPKTYRFFHRMTRHAVFFSSVFLFCLIGL